MFFLIGLTACDNKLNPGFDPDDYEPIVPPEPVRTMDAMASGERVVLSGASLTDIVLKWTPTEKHGNTVYRYEVLIDTIGGDFTKPVETIFSDNNGLESQLTLTHYQANTIGKLAKFRCNTNGTLRWKVRAYCGLDQALSSLEGYFVIFRWTALMICLLKTSRFISLAWARKMMVMKRKHNKCSVRMKESIRLSLN